MLCLWSPCNPVKGPSPPPFIHYHIALLTSFTAFFRDQPRRDLVHSFRETILIRIRTVYSTPENLDRVPLCCLWLYDSSQVTFSLHPWVFSDIKGPSLNTCTWNRTTYFIQFFLLLILLSSVKVCGIMGKYKRERLIRFTSNKALTVAIAFVCFSKHESPRIPRRSPLFQLCILDSQSTFLFSDPVCNKTLPKDCLCFLLFPFKF